MYVEILLQKRKSLYKLFVNSLYIHFKNIILSSILLNKILLLKYEERKI